MIYGSNPNKSGNTDTNKPAKILLRDGTLIDAAHQFVNGDEQLCIYISEREAPIDAKVNLDEIKAVIRSKAGADSLGLSGGGA